MHDSSCYDDALVRTDGAKRQYYSKVATTFLLIGLITTMMGHIKSSACNKTDIRERNITDLVCDISPFGLPNYTRNYCGKPTPIGMVIDLFDMASAPPIPPIPVSLSFVQIGAKVVDIPGDGYVTEFQCKLENSTVPAWYGVLRPKNGSNFTDFEVICSEFSMGEQSVPYDSNSSLRIDRVPLSKPCAVKKGDFLAYGGPNDTQRCYTGMLPPASFILQKNFSDNNLFDNIGKEITGFINPFSNNNCTPSPYPFFTAIFECGCDSPLIGGKLMERGGFGDVDVDDVIYYSNEVIENGTLLSGIALYTENPDDDTVIIDIVSLTNLSNRYESDEPTLCPSFTPNGSIVGVEKFMFPNGPCQLNQSATIKISTHSRTNSKLRNRIGYTEDINDTGCKIEINGRIYNNCSRQYSVAAIKKCYSTFDSSPWEDLKGEINSLSTAKFMETKCGLDYTENKTFGKLFEHNIESLDGPAIYIDLSQELDDGIVHGWKYSINDYMEQSEIFPVVWRKSSLGMNQYEIVCQGYSMNSEMKPMIETYTDNKCHAKKGDFVGFVYTGQSQIPILHEIETTSPEDYLTLLDTSMLSTINSPLPQTRYTLTNATAGKRFSIQALLCAVGKRPIFDENTTYASWMNNTDPSKNIISNLLYERQYTSDQSDIIVDKLNPIPFFGFVTGFVAHGSECDSSNSTDELPIFLMLRPTSSSQYEVICNVTATRCNGTNLSQMDAQLDTPCPVRLGDVFGLITGDSDNNTISYDNVDNYPSVFLNRLFGVQIDRPCHRKYSAGYMFRQGFFPAYYGNSMTDRPFQIFEPTQNLVTFSYSETFHNIQSGIVGKYKVFVESYIQSIRFFIYDSINIKIDDCDLTVTSNDIIIGAENSFDLPNALCAVENSFRVVMEVVGDYDAFGFSDDPNHMSTLNSLHSRTFHALQADGNIKLSLAVVTRDLEDGFDYTQHADVNDIPPMIGMGADQCTNCYPNIQYPLDGNFIKECNTFSRRIGAKTLYNMRDHIDNQSLMFVDHEAPLSAGVLTHWSIVVANPQRSMMAAVWRQLEAAGDIYQLVCKGYATSTSIRKNTIEDIVPVELCNVQEGDLLGFVAYTESDGPGLRLGAESSSTGRIFKTSSYASFKKTEFHLDGTYTMKSHENEPDRFYSMQGFVCPSSGGSEQCRFGLVLHPESLSLDPMQIPNLEQSVGNLIHVDTRASLPSGTLFSWSFVLESPEFAIYPVVWRKVSDTEYMIHCYGYSSDSQKESGQIETVRPFGNCEIGPQGNHYIGFIGKSMYQRIGYLTNSTVNTKTYIGCEDLSQVGFGMKVNLSQDVSDSSSMISEFITDRVYMLEAQMCQEAETCVSYPPFSITSAESIAMDRSVIHSQINSGFCISSLTIDSAQSDVEFHFSVWRRPNSSSGNNLELVRTEKLMTSKFGSQTFRLSSFCGIANDYIGFSFYYRKLPFYTSKSDLLEVQLSSVNPLRPHDIGTIAQFSSSVQIGKMPVRICMGESLNFGNVKLSQIDDDSLLTFYRRRNDAELLFSVFTDAKTVESTVEEIEFVARVNRGSDIHFMLVKQDPSQPKIFEIVEKWTKSGVDSEGTLFHSPMVNLYSMQADLMLAVAAEKDVLFYISEEKSPTQSLNVMMARINSNEANIGDMVEVSDTKTQPIVGMRLEV